MEEQNVERILSSGSWMKDSKPIKSNWLVEVQHLQICTRHLDIDNPKKDNIQANHFFNLFFRLKSVRHLHYGLIGRQFPLCGCSINPHYSFNKNLLLWKKRNKECWPFVPVNTNVQRNFQNFWHFLDFLITSKAWKKWAACEMLFSAKDQKAFRLEFL